MELNEDFFLETDANNVCIIHGIHFCHLKKNGLIFQMKTTSLNEKSNLQISTSKNVTIGKNMPQRNGRFICVDV